MRKLFILGAAAAASTAALATPAEAQWYPRNYGNAYGPRVSPDYAVNRCARSVARRRGRILDVTQVRPTRAHTRVRGVARTSVHYGYGRAIRANLGFTCDVGTRGQVTNLTFDRGYW